MAQINKPTDYFNTILWTGNGTNPRSLTGVGFQPDLVWEKNRDDLVDPTGQNFLYDSVRGSGAEKELISNATLAEGANANQNFGYINSFDSDGFTANAGATNNYYFNKSSARYVAWNWLAGGTASSNTDGSITSTVSANTTSGFSIVSWTGSGANATIGHGIDTPKMIIVKQRTDATTWYVGHDSLGWDKYINLNSSSASTTNTTLWQNTAPTSSVFSVGSSNSINGSGDNLIAYCFAEKKGFSKFGSYTGNGSTDGTFVYTGFKPAFVIIKRTDGAENWDMFDNKRNTFNVVDKILKPSASNAESTFTTMDFVSNGFKHRNSDAEFNASGGNYIYMAFAENPLVGTNNTPATAR